MIKRTCRAKINLALAVGPATPPDRPGAGLHPICSWMCTVDLADTLRIGPTNSGPSTYARRFADGSPVDWPEADDLAVRAHRALEAHVGRTMPIHLELVKSIPPGSGLGGGSADAAGVLLALRDLFSPDLSDDTLRAVAASLGSDVPFFIDTDPTPAIVSGHGERIERLRGVDAEVVLILPPFGCPTGEVYRAFDSLVRRRDFDESCSTVRQAAARQDFSALFNDLRPAAEAARPPLRAIRESIEAATGETVHLSGSGSTLFLINPRVDAAAIRRIAVGCRVIGSRAM